MGDINVDVDYREHWYNFSIAPSGRSRFPTFLSLCEEIRYYCNLPVSAAALADEERSHYEITFLDDRGDDFPLYNDHSLREALHRSPHYLRLLLTYVQNPPGNGKGGEEDTLANVVLTPSQLFNLFHLMRKHGTPPVVETFQAVRNAVKRNSDDGRKLFNIRYELAALIGPFLSTSFGPVAEPIEESEYAPLQSDLSATLLENGVSRATARAAVSSVKALCDCRFASDLLRAKYAVATKESMATSTKKRATKMAIAETAASAAANIPSLSQYAHLYRNLLLASGQAPRDAHHQLSEATKLHPTNEKSPFTLTRRLCKSIEKTVVHFLSHHVAPDTLEYKKKALRKLQRKIDEKLTFAGFNDLLLEAVNNLVEALVRDQNVLKKLQVWATKPITWDSVSVREYGDEEERLRQQEDERSRRLRDDVDREIEEGRSRRSYHRSRSRDSWVAWRGAYGRRSRSRERRDDDWDGGYPYRRDDSLESRRGRRASRERRETDRLDVSMDRPNRHQAWDDLPALGKEANSESDDSADTALSQWARIEDDKEFEQQLERERASRLMQQQRDIHFSKQVSRMYGPEEVREGRSGSRRRYETDKERDFAQTWGNQGRGRSRERSRSRERGYSRERSRERRRDRSPFGGGGLYAYREDDRDSARTRRGSHSREGSRRRHRSRSRDHSRPRERSHRGRSRERRERSEPTPFTDFVGRAEGDEWGPGPYV